MAVIMSIQSSERSRGNVAGGNVPFQQNQLRPLIKVQESVLLQRRWTT